MEIRQTPLKDCLILKPSVFRDERGIFCETYNLETFKKATELDINFVQDNQSISSYGVLRGLHFQYGEMAQAKLVRVIKGKVLDIVVDIRKDSETFGQHFSIILDDENHLQLLVPKGFAHGFITLSPTSIFSYKCDNFYDKESEGGIIYNDANLIVGLASFQGRFYYFRKGFTTSYFQGSYFMKRILITGANGQLGRCIKEVASEFPDCQIVYTTRDELNIEDSKSIAEVFSGQSFDYCINTAAYTNVEGAESNKENAFLSNAEGAKNISQVCDENGAVLIQISTDYVFDGTKTTPYSEEDITSPINVYGASKLRGEELVKEHCRKHFIIRTSWLYSQYGHNFLNTILRYAKEGKPLIITTEQTGTPTSAIDLARAVLKIIESGKEDYGLYHFSNEGRATWYDFAEAILEYSKQIDNTTLAKTEHYRTFAARPKYSVLNSNKIRNTFNIITMDWKRSLRSVIETK